MPNRFNDQIDVDFGPDGNDEMWDLLNIYADGEASPEETAHVEALLKSDVSCARNLAFVKTTTAAVQSFAEMDPPSTLRDAIFAATSGRVTWAARLTTLGASLRQSLTPKYATSLAGLAAAGLLTFVIVHHDSGRFGVINSTSKADGAQVSVVSAPKTNKRDVAAIGGSSLTLPVDVPPTISVAHRPQAPGVRVQMASLIAHGDKKSTAGSAAKLAYLTPRMQNHREDGGIPVVPTAYRPDNDVQFERNPGNVPTHETQPVEIGGDDVQIADSDPMPPIAPSHPTGNIVVGSPQVTVQSEGPHIIVARLTALPPDPNQVLTRADMARNHSMLAAGYDRPALRSMERQEASLSILRSSF